MLRLQCSEGLQGCQTGSKQSEFDVELPEIRPFSAAVIELNMRAELRDNCSSSNNLDHKVRN